MYFKVLKEVSDILNSINCLWAVGGSLVLYKKGLWKSPNDIDILVNFEDVKKIKSIMDIRYTKLELEHKDDFKTKAFFGYNINGINVEFMGDFKIVVDDNIYSFILDEKAIVETMIVEDTIVKMTSIEDWLIAYALMGDPKGRVPIIKEYFKSNGVKNKELIKRALKQYIPESIKREILVFI